MKEFQRGREPIAGIAPPVAAGTGSEEPTPGGERGPRNHLALVYDSPDEQLAAVVPFVRAGLERGERVLYVADSNTEAELTAAFRAAGVDVDAALAAGDLSFHAPGDTYTRDGPFDAGATLDLLEDIVRETTAGDEHERVRITGEMTWALDEETDTLEALLEYETKLNHFYPEKPIVGLCQYDRTRFPPALLYDVIRAHPHQVYDATVCQNFAYVPPDAFGGADGPGDAATALVDTHMERIRTQGELAQREGDIEALAAANRNLLEGDEREVAEHTTSVIQQALDPAVVGVFRYDEAEDDIAPVAVGLGEDRVDPSEVRLPGGYRELLWDAFVRDRTKVFGSFQSPEEIPRLGTVIQSGVVVPFDRHGVLLVGSSRAYAFDEADVQFVSTVATTTEAAFERIHRERSLAEKNEQLEHLTRLNRIVRGIDQALMAATSREGVERAVCERLSDLDPYRFAWIGDRHPLGEELVVKQWAGEGARYLDGMGFGRAAVADGDAGPGESTTAVQGPERTALRTGETQVVQNALTETMFEEWRRLALAEDFHSCISVPLVHHGAEYGVLNLYAADAGVFAGIERDVLTELGSTVAYAVDAVETKAGVHADRRVELGLRIPDGDSVLGRIAAEAGTRIEVETVLPAADEGVRLFFTTAEVEPAAMEAVAGASVQVASVSHIADRDDRSLYEAVLLGRTVPGEVAELGATTRRLAAERDGLECTVELPGTRDPRDFLEALSEAFPGVDAVSVRRRNRSEASRGSFLARVRERLTDKQLEALSVAYHSGYFEWPRERSGQELAASFGVSPSTFGGHLRAGHRKVYRELFGPRATDRDGD